jgi:hypothetical protein
VGSVGGVGWRRPLRPGCRRDGGAGGARRHVGRCCKSLGRGVRACATSWMARGGLRLGGGGNHGGAKQGRLGKDARDGWRCLNRPGSRGHDVSGEMLPCYGAPRHTRVWTGPRTDRRSAACTAHVRRGDWEARGTRAPMHHGARADLGKERDSGGVQPRSVVAWGVDAEAVRACGRVARGSGVAARPRGAERGRHEFVLLSPCLSTNNSKFLNRSVPNDEYESCRSSYPL